MYILLASLAFAADQDVCSVGKIKAVTVAHRYLRRHDRHAEVTTSKSGGRVIADLQPDGTMAIETITMLGAHGSYQTVTVVVDRVGALTDWYWDRIDVPLTPEEEAKVVTITFIFPMPGEPPAPPQSTPEDALRLSEIDCEGARVHLKNGLWRMLEGVGFPRQDWFRG